MVPGPAPNEKAAIREKNKSETRVKHGTRSPSSTVFGDPAGRSATETQFRTLALTDGNGEKIMSNRTSLSALRFQTPYVTPIIPAKAIAVLAFQLEGRVHQPPREYQPKFQEVVTGRSRSGTIWEERKPVTNLLATKLPSGMDISRRHPKQSKGNE